MARSVERKTVDLASYPDLIVIYLGMRVRTIRGLKTLFGLGPQIDKEGGDRPEGLLGYENNIVYSFFPLHVGMRWYWKDFDSLEKWARSEPHRRWWKRFLKDSGGTGFWHETYSMRGGMEAVYDDISKPIGLLAFAPAQAARGSMFSARGRLRLRGEPLEQPAGVSESDMYGSL